MYIILFLFQIYLYSFDHSVRLFFHGALLQNKIYIQNNTYCQISNINRTKS